MLVVYYVGNVSTRYVIVLENMGIEKKKRFIAVFPFNVKKRTR
jgi:hypothetical protein